VVQNFLAVLRDHTAGDPMRQDVKWTNLSRRQISRQLKELGTPAGKNVVSQLLYEHGYRRRKPQKKRTMGQHADRNAQFEKIAELKQEYLDAGKPVISIDSTKKEMLGNFHREGITDAVDPTIVNDHDFASSSDGKKSSRMASMTWLKMSLLSRICGWNPALVGVPSRETGRIRCLVGCESRTFFWWSVSLCH